jgi:serine/threonine-protein kinase HipA
VVSAQEPQPSRFGVERYTELTLARAVAGLEDAPLGSDEDSELSLAGMQDKLLLVDLGDGVWGRPLHGRPSTHILKVDDPRHPGLVVAEAHCLTLARAAGVTTIEHELRDLAGEPVLIVSRFDRHVVDGVVERTHQEDLCQACGIDPDANRGRAKYQRGGGPSLRDAARLLETYATDPVAELDRLVAAVTFTALIGNADAHGKNLALLHRDGRTVALAPLYDTVPTVLWPKLRTEAAMTIGSQRDIAAVTAADVIDEATGWNHPRTRAAAAIDRTCAAVLAAIEAEAIPRDSALATWITTHADRFAG